MHHARIRRKGQRCESIPRIRSCSTAEAMQAFCTWLAQFPITGHMRCNAGTYARWWSTRNPGCCSEAMHVPLAALPGPQNSLPPCIRGYPIPSERQTDLHESAFGDDPPRKAPLWHVARFHVRQIPFTQFQYRRHCPFLSLRRPERMFYAVHAELRARAACFRWPRWLQRNPKSGFGAGHASFLQSGRIGQSVPLYIEHASPMSETGVTRNAATDIWRTLRNHR